jgi:catechol 2,3-dioxygenase-like lactoylglutathione lyase family enzyme
MPDLTGYDHLNLTVADPTRSAAWYTEVLGFEVVLEREVHGMRKVVMRHAGGLVLGLTGHGDRASGDAFSEFRTGMDHVAFAVPDAFWAASSQPGSLFPAVRIALELRSRGHELCAVVDVLRERRCDTVLADPLEPGAGLAAEALCVPCASYEHWGMDEAKTLSPEEREALARETIAETLRRYPPPRR